MGDRKGFWARQLAIQKEGFLFWAIFAALAYVLYCFGVLVWGFFEKMGLAFSENLFINFSANIFLVAAFLYLSGFQNFLQAVNFVGSIFLPMESILLIFIWLKMDKKSLTPPILAGQLARLTVPLILLVFFIALIYSII